MITDVSKTSLHLEETRKNGQEDCHMGGEVNLIEGRWMLEEVTKESIEQYEGKATANAIETYLNEHGPPPVNEKHAEQSSTEETKPPQWEPRRGDVVRLRCGGSSMVIQTIDPAATRQCSCIWFGWKYKPQRGSFSKEVLELIER